MHAQLEIIMPPVDDVEKAVAQIMKPFSEDEEYTANSFWDFYVIGGRYAGAKFESMLEKDSLAAFYEELTERKVTVSSFTCGKPKLDPPSQIPMVDALWREFFPTFGADVACTLFAHSNDQYHDGLDGDIMPFKDAPMDFKPVKLIIANYEYGEEKDTLEAKFMLSMDLWNGCNHEKTLWDGTIGGGIKMYDDYLENRPAAYVDDNTVKEDWLVVTVDYHS